MMKLYSAGLSPYSARIRMQIYAKDITGHAATVKDQQHADECGFQFA